MMTHTDNPNRSRTVTVALVAALLLARLVSAGPVGGYFAVIVSDIEHARAWYTSTLNLNEVSRLTDEGGRFDIVNLSRDGLFVELIQLADAVPRPDGRLQGPFKVGFLVADLDEFLTALPAEIERPDVIEDQSNDLRLVQLRDPDGNIIQVMAPLAAGP